MTHPDTPELDKILEKFWADTRYTKEVKRAGNFTETKAALTRLLAKRELEGRIDVWVQLITTLRFVIEHKYQETTEDAAKHWRTKAEGVLAELQQELAKYE
jgi:hypothetical protein